jgi:hypothetical protein
MRADVPVAPLARELSNSAAADPLEGVVLDAVAAQADKLGFTDVATLCVTLRAPRRSAGAGASASPSSDAATDAAAVPASPSGGAPASEFSTASATKPRTPRGPRVSVGKQDYLLDGSIIHDETVLRLLQLLTEHRKAAEKDARYSEALAASTVLGRVQSGQERARLAEMRARHGGQRAEADAAHAADTAAHNALWDAKSADYDALVAAQLEKLAAAHAAADAALAAELEARAPKRLQPSKELLELRSRQEALGRQGAYGEAAEAQKKADRAEAAEAATMRDSFGAESSRLNAAAAAKAASERDAVLHRAARGRDQMRVARKHDFEQMVQRYRNVVAALDASHKKEAVQLELFLSQQLLAGKRSGGASGSAAPKPAASPSAAGGAGSPGGRPPSPFTSKRAKASPLAPSGVSALRSATERKSAGAAARASK